MVVEVLRVRHGAGAAGPQGRHTDFPLFVASLFGFALGGLALHALVLLPDDPDLAEEGAPEHLSSGER